MVIRLFFFSLIQRPDNDLSVGLEVASPNLTWESQVWTQWGSFVLAAVLCVAGTEKNPVRIAGNHLNSKLSGSS